MESGFEKGNSNNLPVVNMDMIHEFYLNNSDFISTEMRGVKALRASRESYGDNAIGYIQVKRENGKCIVLCRVTPEHKISKKAYKCRIEIDEEDEIVEACTCCDCTAAEGGCKHAIAFLYWLHRRSEEPSPTDVKCYWRKPKLGDAKQKIVKCSDFPGSLVIPEGLNSTFLEKVVAEGPSDVDVQLMKYCKPGKQTLTEKGSLYHLLLDFKENGNDLEMEDFLNFCKYSLSEETCSFIFQRTRDQAKSSLWHEIRYGRVTASTIYDVSRCKTPQGSLCETILGAASPFSTDATDRGKLLEQQVLAAVENQTRGLTMNKFSSAGIQLLPEFPIFGASPDGINNEYVVEIKCPLKNSRVKNYICQGEITPKYRAQIMLQMHMCKRQKGLFAVASPKFEENGFVEVVEVAYDRYFISSVMEQAEDFWKKYIFPMLITDL